MKAIRKTANRIALRLSQGEWNQIGTDKGWLDPSSTASRHIPTLDKLKMTYEEQSDGKSAALFLNGVLLIVGEISEVKAVNDVIKKLYEDRLYFKEKATAAEEMCIRR